MSIPQTALVAFALWTISVPLGAVGWYRWSHILSGTATIDRFRSDAVEGADWYRRAMRAHANCVENLPVFAVLVLVLTNQGLASWPIDALSVAILPARVVQSLVHITLPETPRSVSWRFGAFFLQLLCLFGLAGVAFAGS